MLLIRRLFMLALVSLASIAMLPDTLADEPQFGLPRITAKKGHFVVGSSGKRFRPQGFHYIRIDENGTHYVFRPGWYNKNAVEEMFDDLSRNGFNIVRVFLGLDGVANKMSLDLDFLGNFIDFLERAERHGIYVIPVKTHVPACSRYSPIMDVAKTEHAPSPPPGGDASRYLSQSMIDAKCLFLTDLAGAIRKANARLLTTIFAYELENESCIRMDEAPFSLGEGRFKTANGKTYDLASEEDLQRMVDENTVRWANACVKAIRSVDENAMVSTSFFTYRAVGRSGPGRLLSETSADARFPLRPLALAESDLSYLDLHFYTPDVAGIEEDLASVEFEQLATRCAERGMPLFVGEIGALRSLYPSPAAAAERMPMLLSYLKGRDFRGYCYWTYDCIEQEPLWHAKSGAGEIFNALAGKP